MEVAQITLDDQQRIRISKLLSLEVQDLSMLFEQLKDSSQVASALNKLIKQLDVSAIHSDSEETSRHQAQEAKASLETEKINLEQRLRQYESKVNNSQKQLMDLRQKLLTAAKESKDAVAKAAELESKLVNQQSGSLHANAELGALKARIETLEAEKRETLSALERKVSELEQANADYQSMSTRYQEVKKESSKFESEAREAKSSEMAQRLQKQAIEQELEMLNQRMNWANSELEAKSTEFTFYRTEKNTQILQLQADLDQARVESTTLSQSNTSLQRRLKDQQDKLEETLEKNKELQDQNVVQEEQFRVEMETQRRLGELWERAAIDTKDRIADLELTLEDMQKTLSIKDAEYQETISEITEEKLQLQIKLEQSTTQVTQLKQEQKRADELLNKAGLIDTSGTSGFDIGRMGVLSPTAAAAARLQKTGMSLTQVYTRYMELQAEHAQLKTENARLQESMDSIVQELSDGAPLIREQQLEYQRLEQHAKELSAQLEASSTEKEQIAFGAREALAQLDGVVKERDMLHKENQDLDRQVQNLLWRLKAPNAPQSLAPVSTLSTNDSLMTEGEKAIDEHLVLFSNIQELQQQNKKLREVARELTREQELAQGAEAQARKKEELDVIEEAERVIESMREDIGAKELQIATYKQELDMMRRILKTSNIRNVPAVAAAVESAASASIAGGPSEGEVDKSANGHSSEYAKLLADLQKTFDAYRNETSVDNRHLKDQLQQAQTSNSEYRIQLGRAKSQIEVLNERYNLLTDNSAHQLNEMAELRKRCTYLQDVSTRQEIANQKLSSDLYAERDSAARQTAEINNMKTEKALWKSFETRLLEENQALLKEKGHLNELLQTVQNMTNELERGNEQTKRRLESSVTSKEQEVETLKEKLKEEVESGKRLRDRREIEAKEWQTKIDTLQSEYQSSREALIAAKTSLEHTNAKVEDLAKQIKSREDQLAVYQQKPSGTESTEATREEQLQAQVVQLHADLARHQAEADASRQHLAQFQAISQTNEDRLAEMTATYEEFKKEHDQKLEENAQVIKTLETKLANAEERAQSAASNLVEMQNKVDEERGVWRKEKDELEVKLRNLENVQIQMNAIENRYRRDLRIQGAQTKEAHENYERELVNHAKDIETLTRLKEKYSMQTVELERYKTASESAMSNLQVAELSWEGQKSVLQKTLSEVEKRCTELKEQNDKLHRHLEDVSAQALTIQQRMNAPIAASENLEVEGADSAPKGSMENQLGELRDVIRFVRREKEILECQHELNLQESRRLKQQLDQTNRSLEETRVLLTEERSKQQEVMVSKQQHEQMLEKINQLNLLRESNTTLRAENERLQKRVSRLEDTTRELQSKLNPMKEQVREMKADLDFSKDELKQVGEDRDRWRMRTVEIMAKHDRIDPTEFQELKDTVEKNKLESAETDKILATLKTEAEELKATNKALQSKVTEASAAFAKVSGHAQAWRKKCAEEVAKAEELQKEIASLKARIAELEKLLEEAKKAGSESDSASQAKYEIEKVDLTKKKEELEKNFEQTRARLNLSIQRNKQLANKIKELQASLEEEKKSVAAAAAAATTTATTAGSSPSNEEIEARIAEEKQKVAAELTSKHEAAIKMNEMRQQLKIQTKDKEIQNLKNQLAANGTTNGTPTPATETQQRPTAPGGALSPNAQAFRPQGAAASVRPTNPVRVLRNNASATGAAAATGPAPVARQMAGLPPRPGTPPQQGRPTPGPGQSRLRPPLGDRVAAAAAASSTVASPAAPSSTVPAAATPKPAAASGDSVQTITATSAPPTPVTTSVVTPAPATTAVSGQPSRLLIKRRREEELPGQINPSQSSSPSLSATTVVASTGSGSASPSMGPTAVVAAPEQKSSPMIIKRQRQLPMVEAPVVTTPETTEGTAVAESKPQTITIQRKRVVSTSDTTETQLASPPTGASAVITEPTTSLAPADVLQAETSPKTSPHGQKRRHETTESVQESITIVSTPGPTDVDEVEESSTPEPSQETMVMDVDDVPPVKRARPSSHVVITELPEESTSTPTEITEDTPATSTSAPTSALASVAPGTPGPLTDFEEGEIDVETSEALATTTTTDTSVNHKSTAENEVKKLAGEGESEAQEAVADGAAADTVLEEELEESLDPSYDATGAVEVTEGFEDVDVHTPQGHEAVEEEGEGDLDLDLDEHREHEGDGEASESVA
ncbi:hypothetical protein EDD11_004679 [Mortierella claussenii]|nr:hypothetical protein EDD11_004679 [Mortierella claussenii]